MMAYIGALHPEDHVFSDVGGVVGHSFQISGDDQSVEGFATDLESFETRTLRGRENFAVQIIHDIVTLQN
jgi:hypothetical protein